ncbi:MAG: hypothetical protein AAFR65_04955 [Pseudomonadota bacterium]
MKMVYLFWLAALSACASACGGDEKAAVLALGPGDDLGVITSALSATEGRATLELGPPDPRQQPVVTVLPPKPTRYETRSPALPAVYDIVLADGACLLRRRTDGIDIVLPQDVPCTPYKP